eukprot:m.96108 g.96108  ORF g.96108 m.96108 type:complete len:181 (+) comp16636_c0_seq2:201-743(+)
MNRVCSSIPFTTGFGVRVYNAATVLLVALSVIACSAALQTNFRASNLPADNMAPQARPPWWIIYNVIPSGPEKDMGGWTMSSFSSEQQNKFGVDDEGTVVDKSKYQAAIEQVIDQAKKEWPELVGVNGKQAAQTIRDERPDLTRVEVVPADSMMTMDFRLDRVRVMVDEKGVVTQTPHLG